MRMRIALVSFVSVSAFLLAHSQRTINNCEVDVLMLIDSSGSVNDDFKGMRAFVKEVGKMMTIGDRGHHVALLQYSSESRATKWPRYDFGDIKNNKQFNDIADQMRDLRGLTDTTKAFEIAYEMFQKRRRKREWSILIHVSDGIARDFPAASKIAKKMREQGDIYIGSIAIADPNKPDQMRNFTGRFDDSLMATPPNHVQKTREALTPVLLNCVPETTSTTTTTTTTTTKSPITDCEMDLVFVMDKSSSVKEVQESYITSMLNVLQALTISPFHTRVALIEFASPGSAVVAFHLSKHSTLDTIEEDVRASRLNGGTTDCASGLKLVAGEYNSTYYGARPSLAKKVVIVITDGGSQQSPLQQAEALRLTDVEIFAWGQTFTDAEGNVFAPNKDQLLEIADDERHVFMEQDGLNKMINQVKKYNQRCKRI